MPDGWTDTHPDPVMTSGDELGEAFALLTPTHRLLRYFAYLHLPLHLRGVSESYLVMASELDDVLPPGPEKDQAMARLLESKDSAVRGLLPSSPTTFAHGSSDALDDPRAIA